MARNLLKKSKLITVIKSINVVKCKQSTFGSIDSYLSESSHFRILLTASAIRHAEKVNYTIMIDSLTKTRTA